MSDLREADAAANRASTDELLRDHPLAPATRRAIAGFRLRALLRRFPPTAALLRSARRLRGDSR